MAPIFKRVFANPQEITTDTRDPTEISPESGEEIEQILEELSRDRVQQQEVTRVYISMCNKLILLV